jgi:hypothetical protein
VGSYSQLNIGRVGLQWKYMVPTFLTFLFSDEDYYADYPPDPENAERTTRWVGYATTVEHARAHLSDWRTGHRPWP